MHLKNIDGFTFISIFITMSIIFISLPLIVHLLQMIPTVTAYDELSVQHFFLFLRDELFSAVDYKVEQNQIILELSDGDKAYFFQNGSNLIRNKSGGYEVYLRDIQQVNFKQLAYGVHTEITTLQGAQYEKTIIFYE